MANNEQMGVAPRLRFPDFTDAWEQHVLGDYLSESRIAGSDGSTARKLTVKLWGNGVVAKNEAIKGSTGTQYYRRKAGQFIYSKLDFLNGAFGIIPDHLDGFESTVDLPCFDVKSHLDRRFLTDFVGRPEFFLRFGEIADGGRKAKRIQVDTLLSLPIAVPSREEQRKVAACLTSLDDVIAAQAQRIATLKAHKQGLMQRLFPREGEAVPRLRFPECREAPTWKQVKLDDVAKRGSGHTPSRSKPEYYDGGVKWVSLADSKRLDSGYTSETSTQISEAGVANSSAVLHPVGSVILCRDAAIGKSAILKEAMAVSQHFMAWACNESQLSNWFLYYSLQSMKPLFERVASGSTIATIGLPFFAALNVAIPNVTEQRRIADSLWSLDNQIAAESEWLDALRRHESGLTQQLFPSVDVD